MALSSKMYAPSNEQATELTNIHPHLLFNKIAGIGITAFGAIMAYSSLVLPDSFYDIVCQTDVGNFSRTVQIDNIAIGNKDPLASYQSFKLEDGSVLQIPVKLCTAIPISQPTPANG